MAAVAEKTHIQWADSTWPVVNGCRRVSAGCEGCYAERLTATRLKHLPKYAGLAVMTPSGPRWTGESRLWAPDLALPLKWKRPRRIFVADMGDLFYEEVRGEDIDKVFAVMVAAPQHTYLVLTKRAERMRAYLADPATPGRVAKATDNIMVTREIAEWPLRQVHAGVSVEDQRTADERIPILLQTPAAVRWVSAEPLLEAVDFEVAPCRACNHPGNIITAMNEEGRCSRCDGRRFEWPDWIVVGGESGPNARPFDTAWARSIIAQCRAVGVPVFFKQAGSRPMADGRPLKLRDPKGGAIEEWPEDLRVREFPETHL